MSLFEKIGRLRDFENLQTQYRQLEEKTKALDDTISGLKEQRRMADEEYRTAEKRLNEAKIALGEYEGCIQMEELGIPYKPLCQNLNKIDKEINMVQRDIGTLLSSESVFVCQYAYTVNGSATKGERFQKNYCDNLLIGFNAYFEKKKKSVTANNYAEHCRLIRCNFERACKRGESIGFALNSKYLDLCLKILQLELDQKIAKDKEKARLREERKRMREQALLLEEAQREKERLLAQKKAMDIAYAKALSDAEREQIKSNIQALDKRINDIDYRVNNPKAGWVYIIHSDSLPNMAKIGVSRRLNGPYERISELSSSSLPFPFVLDGFCFSDDAFAVESGMHEYFDDKRVAANREFFYVSAEEAIGILEDKFHQNVVVDRPEENDEYKENL